MVVMLNFLTGLISGILGFLNGVLPDSPFQSFLQGAQGLQTGLGWLNWVVPIGDMILVFTAWLAVLLVWASVDMALGKSTGIFGKLVGRS